MSLPKYKKLPFTSSDIQALLVTMHRAADAARVPTMTNFRQVIDVENKESGGRFDPVTIADKQAEQAIKQVVLAEHPEHGFFGEESEVIVSESNPLWIVDPIDGTRAFITGMPLWGTLIAVYDGQDAMIGMLDQPFLNERFVGFGTVQGDAVDWSSTLTNANGVAALSTRKNRLMEDAVLQTTGPEFFSGPREQHILQAVTERVSMVRYGGDCYCYALLAMGFVDIVVESGLNPYDIAALIPIVRGAGGVITNWQGGPVVEGGSVLACGSAQLHADALSLIAASA